MKKRRSAVKSLRKKASIVRSALRSSILLVFVSFNYSFAQTTTVGLNGTLTPFDVFQGVEVDYHALEQVSFFSSLQFGVRKSYGQKRTFPRVGIGALYWIPVIEKFSIAPTGNIALSWLNLSKSNNEIHRYEEYLAGLTLKYGDKWQIRQVTTVGYVNERFQSGLQNKLYRAGGFDYALTLGIYYAL